MWANVEPMSGREVVHAQQQQQNLTHRITTRYRTDITTDSRLLWGSRIFNVRSVMTVSERDRYTVIKAEEGPIT